MILECKHLYRSFGGGRSLFGKARPHIQAVNDVSLAIEEGTTLGIVGESGCGKSTLGRMLVGLDQATEGEILFRGQSLAQLLRKDPARLRRQIQFVFQDPLSSLNPRKTVAEILAAPLKLLLGMNKAEQEARIKELMALVNLRPEFVDRYPHEFSGGQSQRIGIARALAANAELIILDEPVSALDVSVQAQILNLLRHLKQQFNLTYVFISHDLAVVENICDVVAVMYLGRVVEYAPRAELFARPRHPYTRVLLDSVPRKGSRAGEHVGLKGELPNPADPPPGCAFEPRCAYAESRCRESRPPLQTSAEGHTVACFRIDEIALGSHP